MCWRYENSNKNIRQCVLSGYFTDREHVQRNGFGRSDVRAIAYPTNGHSTIATSEGKTFKNMNKINGADAGSRKCNNVANPCALLPQEPPLWELLMALIIVGLCRILQPVRLRVCYWGGGIAHSRLSLVAIMMNIVSICLCMVWCVGMGAYWTWSSVPTAPSVLLTMGAAEAAAVLSGTSLYSAARRCAR